MPGPTVHDVTVPFLDLRAMHRDLAEAIGSDIDRVIGSSAFVNGPEVSELEEAFAEFCGVEHCVGVASGLDALRLALVAAGVRPGDEVVVPAMTFVATWEAVSQAGAVPVPVDIQADDYCMDPEALRSAIGPNTAAVMPVHLYGQLSDMTTLRTVCATHGLLLVEDAAQAHGAEREGIGAGGSGAGGAFSFYPGKNLGAFGDAGAFVTGQPELAARMRSLREHGQSRKYIHDEIGWTARLDTIQAAVLLRKLPLLSGWNDERRGVAAAYTSMLAGVGDLELPPVAAGSEHVWHLYVVKTARPEELAEHLSARGIASGRHYPVPPHLTGAYAPLGLARGAFPVTEDLARGCLSLPIFPGMSEAQVAAVVDGVSSWFGG